MDNLGYKDVIIPQSIFFDRIYPSISIASADAPYDGVAEGRYILIDSTNKQAYGWLKAGTIMKVAYSADTDFSAAFNNVIFYSSNNFISYQPSVIIRSNNDFLVPVKETESSTTYTIFKRSVSGWAPTTEINNENFSANDGEVYKKVGNTYQYIGKIATDSWITAKVNEIQQWVREQNYATETWVSALIQDLDTEGETVIYSSGKGISINNEHQISFSGVSIDSPIYWAGNRNYLTINIDSSLQTQMATGYTKLGVKLASQGGLTFDSNGIAIDTTWLSQHTSGDGSGTGVVYSAGTGITISDDPIPEISFDPTSVFTVEPTSTVFWNPMGACLNVYVDGTTIDVDQELLANPTHSYLKVKIDDTQDGIAVGDNGIYINSAWLASFIGSEGGGGIVYSAGAGIDISNSQISVQLGSQESLVHPQSPGCGLATQGGRLRLSSEVIGLLTNVTGYTASNGITLNNKNFELNLDSDSGLTVTGAGLRVWYGTGLTINETGQLCVNPGKSITTNASIDSHPLEVHCADNNALYFDNDGLKVKCLSGGIGIDGNGQGLKVLLKNQGGLLCDINNGLYIDTTWLASQIGSSSGSGTTYTAGSGINITNNTISLDNSVLDTVLNQSSITSTVLALSTVTGKTYTSYIVKKSCNTFIDIRGGGVIESTDSATVASASIAIQISGNNADIIATDNIITNTTEIGLVDMVTTGSGTVEQFKLYKGVIGTIPVLTFTCNIASSGQKFYLKGFYPNV